MKNIVFGVTLLSLTSTMAFAVPPVALEENERASTTIGFATPKDVNSDKRNNSLIFYIPMDEDVVEEVSALKQTTIDEEKALNAGKSKKTSYFGSIIENCVKKVCSFFNKIKSVFGF